MIQMQTILDAAMAGQSEGTDTICANELAGDQNRAVRTNDYCERFISLKPRDLPRPQTRALRIKFCNEAIGAAHADHVEASEIDGTAQLVETERSRDVAIAR